MPFTQSLTDAMAAITTMTSAVSIASIIAEIASAGQIDNIGNELRGYMNYSGISQVTGYGYGLILSTAMTTPVQSEINAAVMAHPLDLGFLVLLKRRELIDDTYYLSEMAKHGYTPAKSDLIFDSSMFYPTGQDFVHFAARDVFNPAAVKSGGLDEMFPSDILPYAAKAGVSEEVLKWYWASHWQLPSPNMAYEMLHRGVIDKAELEQLLKVADWAPGYIQKLIDISYRPLTRVDARRMYISGVLSDAEFFQSMKDLGYNDENANRYLAWVKTQTGTNTKDLSQSALLNAYKKGLKDRASVIEYLTSMGYDNEESELLVSMIDTKNAEESIDDNIGVLQWQYEKYEIDEPIFLDALGKMEIPRGKAQKYLSEADNRRTTAAKTPSTATVKRWYQGDLITQDEASDYLTRLGYRDNERSLYLIDWNRVIAD